MFNNAFMVVFSPGAKSDPDCCKRKTMRELLKNCPEIEYYGLIYFLSGTINQNVSFVHFEVKTVLINLSVAIHSSLKPVFPIRKGKRCRTILNTDPGYWRKVCLDLSYLMSVPLMLHAHDCHDNQQILLTFYWKQMSPNYFNLLSYPRFMFKWTVPASNKLIRLNLNSRNLIRSQLMVYWLKSSYKMSQSPQLLNLIHGVIVFNLRNILTVQT